MTPHTSLGATPNSRTLHPTHYRPQALRPSLRVIAVEPRGKRLATALQQKRRVLHAAEADKLLPTIADAIRTVQQQQ